MNEKVSALLNDQINKEMYSAYLYLDLSSYYTSKGLDGFAKWYDVQAQEEMTHARMMYQYLHDNDVRPELLAIAKPDKEITNVKDPVLIGLEHEKYVTSLINNIYAVAKEVNDFRTLEFLSYFVKEQGEEEKNATDLVNKMELFGSDPRSLYLLDQELGARVFTNDAAAE
ncbi:MAG: ferritin [Allobaculum sp.]